jgi:hypothetical protein
MANDDGVGVSTGVHDITARATNEAKRIGLHAGAWLVWARRLVIGLRIATLFQLHPAAYWPAVSNSEMQILELTGSSLLVPSWGADGSPALEPPPPLRSALTAATCLWF